MNPTSRHYAAAASRGEPCVVAGLVACVRAVWIDSGIAAGLVVVDSNRPAPMAANARGLLKQFGAAH